MTTARPREYKTRLLAVLSLRPSNFFNFFAFPLSILHPPDRLHALAGPLFPSSRSFFFFFFFESQTAAEHHCLNLHYRPSRLLR